MPGLPTSEDDRQEKASASLNPSGKQDLEWVCLSTLLPPRGPRCHRFTSLTAAFGNPCKYIYSGPKNISPKMVKLFGTKMTKWFFNSYLLDLFDSNFVSIFEEKKQTNKTSVTQQHYDFFLFRNHIRQNAAIAIESFFSPKVRITNIRINNNHSE